ncbi:universal stress protein [Tunicatimonas pelagia]|uniref:universal stress protein n=1 Tax=Tunicatimonas pelagia TaxID=931531 RepID=UPI002665FB1B|nr:universal stress protein [Tunicatimonas pelagia]WKN45602.1 universal stress protein [Tunicatimonas pelagia]
MKTILFPTDFSERARKALDQAIVYAERFSLKLIIYHVYHRPVVEDGSSQQLAKSLEELERGIDSQFNRLLDQHKKLSTINYEFRKELGFLIESIINASKEEGTHLIVMATKGARGFGELWGTKTARIIKSVDVPVLVLPDHTSLVAVERVGLVCDYSKEAQYHTLDFLLEVVEELKLDVDVITLNRDEKTMTTQEIAYRQLVRRKLENVPTTFNFTFSSEVKDEIIDYSKNNNIGLIAILPKSYSFIERLFRESLTEKMTFHSPLPLLVLK